MDNKNLKEIFLSAVKSHQKGDFEIAENLYKKILDMQPNNLDIMNNLGALFIQSSKEKKAKNILQKVLQIDPNNISI